MVFPKSGKRSSEQGKSLGEVRREPPSGLGSILEFSLMDQSDHKVINGSHHFAGGTNCHAGGIFLESYITAIMQTCFDAPMLTTKM